MSAAATSVTTNYRLLPPEKVNNPEPDFNAILLEELKKPLTFSESKPLDEARFINLYDQLIEQNKKLRIKSTFSFGKQPSILIKPTDPKIKTSLYNLLDMIDKIPVSDTQLSPGKEHEIDKAELTLKQNLAAAFFLTLKDIQYDKNAVQSITNNQGQQALDALKPKLLVTFIDKIYTSNNEYASRFLPFIQTLREYLKGFHSTSFNDKITTEDVIRKQLQEAKDGINNEFSILSLIYGTRSQKIAAQTTFIAAVGSGLWGLVAFLEKNPTTSAMLAGTIAAAGTGGISVIAIFGAAAVSYYVVRTIQDRYAKYFNLIRVMNEYMIVLNKIQRLTLLSLSISKKYYFDVNIDEILSQIKILFTRFDQMLSNDDKSKIEKDVESMTILPDIKEEAEKSQTGIEGQVIRAADDANGDSEPQTKPPDQNEPGILAKMGAKLKQSTLTLTFDEVKWTKLLNDDIIKLNIYFTTAMTEFNMILNVIQMGLLTSEQPDKKDLLSKATTEISRSSEYRKIVIGILLNDILKLRVDFSYCNRGGGWFGLTKTNEELVCLENTGSDPAGNKRFLFKEKLHEHMKKLVETLNSPNCPYDKSINEEIQVAVVEPYKKLLNVVTPVTTSKKKEERFFLTQNAKFDDNALTKGKQTVVDEIKDVKYGGGFFSKMKDIEPSTDRDNLILKDLYSKPYFLVSDNNFQSFLISVNKFVKEASKLTDEEQKEVGQITDAIRENVKTELESAGPQQSQTGQPMGQSPGQSPESQMTNVGGSRRFTRKRVHGILVKKSIRRKTCVKKPRK